MWPTVLQLSMVYNRGTHTWQGQAKNPSKQRTPGAAWPSLESQTDPALNGLGNKRNVSSCLTIVTATTPEELSCTRAAGEAASSPDHNTSGQQTYSTCQEPPHCKSMRCSMERHEKERESLKARSWGTGRGEGPRILP